MTDRIITNNNFWDCDCEENYIHPVSQKQCEICGALEEDQPPARQNEIDAEEEVQRVLHRSRRKKHSWKNEI